MNRPLIVPTLCLLGLFLGGAMAPAEATHGGSSWIGVAGDFTVGGAQFSFGYNRPAYGGYYQPNYYYRVRQPLPSYWGHRCTSACYVRDPYTYHHASCPLVGAFFDYHHYRPAWGGYGIAYQRPYVQSYPWYGWRSWDGGWRGRGHGHHKHHSGCRH